PGVRRRARLVPARRRAAGARAAEPVGHRLPDRACHSGIRRERRARLEPRRRSRSHLVRRARDGLGAVGATEPLRLCAALCRAAERVPLPSDRRVPAREPARGRVGTGGLVRPGRVSRGLAARAALVGALAALWAAAAWLLWSSTTVPPLHLPHLDPRAYFSASQLRAAASYSRLERLDWLLSTLAKLGALVVYARYGVRFARESAAGRMGTGMLLGMLGFALLWAV